MAVFLQHQREKIGVDDKEAKQKQVSPERLKQQQLNQSQKQLSATTDQKGDSNVDNAIKETPNKTADDEGDKKINTIKMAASMEAGVAITEISAPASALPGAIPSTSVAAAHAAPLAVGLAAPLFGFF